MGKESKTVAFRIDEEKHQEWNDYAEENPEYESLSHMIRRSVQREIGRDAHPPTANHGGSGVDERVGELLETVERVHGRLDGIEDTMQGVTDSMHASSGVDEQLPIEVFEAVPVGKENAITAERVSQVTGRKVPSVRFALENLRRNTGTVKKVTPLELFDEQPEDTEAGQERGIEGEPRWYKVEGA